MTWSSNAVTGGSYCLIPIKLHTAGTQQRANLKLYVGTERIKAIDATMSLADPYQESFARVKLFAQRQAQNQHEEEIAAMETKSIELERAIAHLEQRTTAEQTMLRDRPKRNTSKDTCGLQKRDSKAEGLMNELVVARRLMSSMRPVQVFRLVVPEEGEVKPFHIPSEQKSSFKASTASASVRKDRKRARVDSGQSLLVNPSRSAKKTSRHISPVSVPKIQPPPSLTAPSKCFYIRPEHLPEASYRAIYPNEQSYAGLVLSISSKFELAIADIGLIYFYNGDMAPIVVDEASFPTLHQEQDLIVQFPFVMHSSGQTTQSLLNMPNGFHHVYDNRSAHDSGNVFDQYLSTWITPRNDESYGDSVDSWSEITDEVYMKDSFTRCSTAQTSLTSEDQYMDSSYIQNSIAVDSEIDRPVDYNFHGPAFAFTQLQAPECAYSITSEDMSTHRSQSTMTQIRSTTTSERNFEVGKMEVPLTDMSSVVEPMIPAPEKILESDAMEKNRVAAAKCRLSRKAREKQLVDKSREQAERNAKLRKEVSSLEAQVREVRELLAAHNTCA